MYMKRGFFRLLLKSQKFEEVNNNYNKKSS